ncbi:MAG: DUF4625 domain-containing protein [Dysgonamonadaceae bacterium]|jgi:hypothetical protein|nr:DUF4625 domain-containing protein [Dysgonamonadaceae bacterium]
MKTIIYITSVCFLAISFFLSSCDDGDTTKPVIDLAEPEDGEQLLIGDDVHFVMDLSDNEALASYKIEIHNNFDNHEHVRAGAVDETVAFTFERTYALSGQKNVHIHHHDIEIPENATPGDYHLMVYCTDAAGNEAHLAVGVVLSREAEGGHHHHDDGDDD